DTSGAEHLLGMGDMLYMPPGSSAIQRVHGSYISEQETADLVSFLKKQGEATYDESVLEQVEDDGASAGFQNAEEHDERYDEAVAIVCESGQASISMVQRRLRIGYNRAARIIEMMEKEGVVGPADGAKPREVLARHSYD
ncbi:MAG: cell division protein FtsK, partial [Desulfobacterales bacterium]|nr:cell division protein FtsK [Desulfobacterales bacterium]